MAIDYFCCANIDLSAGWCRKFLVHDLGLVIPRGRPQDWLENEAATVIVRDCDPVKPQVPIDMFGFAPQVSILMRPVLSARWLELGMQTIVRVVDCMLRNTQGDIGFSIEYERVLLLRHGNSVDIRDDFDERLGRGLASLISVPLQSKAFSP